MRLFKSVVTISLGLGLLYLSGCRLESSAPRGNQEQGIGNGDMPSTFTMVWCGPVGLKAYLSSRKGLNEEKRAQDLDIVTSGAYIDTAKASICVKNRIASTKSFYTCDIGQLRDCFVTGGGGGACADEGKACYSLAAGERLWKGQGRVVDGTGEGSTVSLTIKVKDNQINFFSGLDEGETGTVKQGDPIVGELKTKNGEWQFLQVDKENLGVSFSQTNPYRLVQYRMKLWLW